MSGNLAPKRSSFGPTSGLRAHQVDVIVDQHQRALREAGVDAAGRIRQDHPRHAEAAEHSHREGDRGQRMAFVEVHPAGQRHHLAAARQAADQPARMPHDVRRRPVRDVAVGDFERLVQSLGKIAQPGAEHHRHVGAAEAPAAQELRGLHCVVERRHMPRAR